MNAPDTARLSRAEQVLADQVFQRRARPSASHARREGGETEELARELVHHEARFSVGDGERVAGAPD